jgi:predicted trehalose synthase
MMDTGRLCAVTNDRSRAMSPAPVRATLVRNLANRFKELGVTKASVATNLADAAVDMCLPNLHPGSCGGKSLLHRLWEELDTVVDRLAAEPDNDIDRGGAQQLAFAIAIIQNPYQPSTPGVKKEAQRRWEVAQEKGTYPPLPYN